MKSEQNPQSPALDDRVLGLFQDRRDTDFAVAVFKDAGIPLAIVADVPELCAELSRGVGTVIITEGSLRPQDWESLANALEHQPTWSTVPFIVLLSSTQRAEIPAHLLSSEVILLDQPVRLDPLLAAVRSALKSRERQYLLRDRMGELEREIENRKQAEKRNLLYAAIVESTSQAIIGITKSLDGTIETWNKGAESIYGYTAEEVVGRNLTLLAAPGYSDDFQGILETVRRGGHILGHETLRRRKDGSIINVSITVSPIKDEAGNIIGASKMGIDITARKKAEADLQESEERFRALVSASSEILYQMSADWRVMDNLSGGTFLRSKEAPTSSWLQEYIFPEDRAHVMAVIQDAIRTKGKFELEHRVRRADGGVGWLFSRAAPLFDANGEIREWFGAASDITERKQLEMELEARAAELEEANRELQTFNYSVAHDLRQPLNIISGYCQAIKMLCGDRLDQECASHLQRVYEGTLRMSKLIEALLNFSRLSRVELHRETVDLSKMARELAEGLKVTNPKRRATFQIADGVTVHGDPDLLRVALDNLIGNAWKYTSLREETIIEFGAAKIDCETELGCEATCFVRDNGSGFDMAEADKLFVAFKRLSGAEETRGFGIGLATVERIIRRHGGRIRAEGEPGKGATFWFTLPAKGNM